MKILFINHKDIEGGAAIAAFRLCKGLETFHGTENYFIVSRKNSGAANVFTPWEGRGETSGELGRFLEFLADRVLSKFGLQYYWFPFSSRFILKKAREIKPDVISLHNTHGGYFNTALIAKLSYVAPVVWTLHDMWAFTANGAHTFGDESWKTMRGGKEEKRIYPHVGMGSGRKLLRRKKKIYRRAALDFVTPSRWLTELAKQAPVLEGKNIYHIYHGIDTEVFKPLDKKVCREALGLPSNGRVVFFSCADDLNRSTWKAGQLLLDILRSLDSRSLEPVHALVLGKGNIDILGELKNVKVRHLGFIHGEPLLPVLYSAADVLIFPTRAENLSLVLMEANACGTPSVTFDIGGNRDQVQNGVNGYLVPPFDTETFAAKTLELLDNPELRTDYSSACREKAEQSFSLKNMAAEYYRLFQQVKRT